MWAEVTQNVIGANEATEGCVCTSQNEASGPTQSGIALLFRASRPPVPPQRGGKHPDYLRFKMDPLVLP